MTMECVAITITTGFNVVKFFRDSSHLVGSECCCTRWYKWRNCILTIWGSLSYLLLYIGKYTSRKELLLRGGSRTFLKNVLSLFALSKMQQTSARIPTIYCTFAQKCIWKVTVVKGINNEPWMTYINFRPILKEKIAPIVFQWSSRIVSLLFLPPEGMSTNEAEGPYSWQQYFQKVGIQYRMTLLSDSPHSIRSVKGKEFVTKR